LEPVMWGRVAATVGKPRCPRNGKRQRTVVRGLAEGFEHTCDFGLASAVAKPQRFSMI
jgi:hypothetical protein